MTVTCLKRKTATLRRNAKESWAKTGKTGLFIYFFLIQFNVPLKIISAHMGRKRENPEKNHLAHPQAELGLSHMWPERGSNPHQTQR